MKIYTIVATRKDTDDGREITKHIASFTNVGSATRLLEYIADNVYYVLDNFLNAEIHHFAATGSPFHERAGTLSFYVVSEQSGFSSMITISMMSSELFDHYVEPMKGE